MMRGMQGGNGDAEKLNPRPQKVNSLPVRAA
jgi:hypothetical protein